MTETRRANLILWSAVAAVIVLLFATPSRAAEPAEPPMSLSFDEALLLCRAAYFGDEASAAKARAIVQSLSQAEQRSIAVVCIAYGRGAQDLLDADAARAEVRNRT